MKLKSRIFKVTIIYIVVMALLLSYRAQNADAAIDLMGSIERSESYIKNTVGTPGYGIDWYMAAMARDGYTIDDGYMSKYYKNLAAYINANGSLKTSNYNDYARVILSLTSLGVDAGDVAGVNLLKFLADYDKIKQRGSEGYALALIALKSSDSYHIPESVSVRRQNSEIDMINDLLGRELPSGGFGKNDVADPGISGLVVTAFSPYYRKSGYEAVTASVDRTLDYLSRTQDEQTGGYANSIQTARVAVALTAMGINPEEDQRFLKNNMAVTDALIEYQLSNGSYCVNKGEQANDQASYEGFLAMVAFKRLLTGEDSLFNMRGVTLHKGGMDGYYTEPETTTIEKTPGGILDHGIVGLKGPKSIEELSLAVAKADAEYKKTLKERKKAEEESISIANAKGIKSEEETTVNASNDKVQMQHSISAVNTEEDKGSGNMVPIIVSIIAAALAIGVATVLIVKNKRKKSLKH